VTGDSLFDLAAGDSKEQAPARDKMGDVVLTPAWAARDMLDHFKPSGVVLDPCRGPGGAGVFFDLLRGMGSVNARWCEITDGRNFFAWRDRVDWVIGNPPYSLTREWFLHSYKIADHLLYLVPLRNVFSGDGFIREVYGFGGIREIREYGTGNALGFPMGNAVGAFHIERGYGGPTTFSFAERGEQGSLFEGREAA
jgi:hypothetical protein